MKTATLSLLVVGLVGFASGATEVVIPLLPAAALPYVIGAGLGAAGLATLKTSAIAGAYLYLRNKGAIDLNLEVNKKEADGGYSQVFAIGKPAEASPDSEIAGTDHLIHYRRQQNHKTEHHQRRHPFVSEKLVSAIKKHNCSLRLMCELATVPADELGSDEKIFLALHGGVEKLERSGVESEEKTLPMHAYLIGKTAHGGRNACGQVFNGCPFGRATLVKNWKALVL